MMIGFLPMLEQIAERIKDRHPHGFPDRSKGGVSGFPGQEQGRRQRYRR